MKIHKLTQLAACAAVFCAASSYAVSNDALLDLLVKKGVLTDNEATAVAAELKEENKGVTFSAKGKETVKLRFNGRMQFQYDALSADDSKGGAASVDADSSNHFYFRRLFFGVKATLENGVYAESVFDFARDGEGAGYGVGFDKAIIGYKFDDALEVQLGYTKVPFGFEETTSSSKLQTVERSVANRFFADDIDFSSRHTGVHLKGDLGGGFSYAGALVNSAQGEGSRLNGASNGSNDMAAFGRLQWESNGFTVGVDGGLQSNNYKITGDLKLPGAVDVKAFTGYVNYKFEGLNLLAEVFSADMDSAGDAEGHSFRASYKVDKFEPVFRYAHMETDKFLIDTDELVRRAPKGQTLGGMNNEIDSYYVGLNYYYSKAVTFMAGYEMAEAEDDAKNKTEIEGFRARVQVLW